MSFPNIPNITPNITINREQVINLLLASVALEELGLSHIINAEAEKIQFILGTLPGTTPPAPPTIDELIEIDKLVEHTMRTVIKEQMLLEFKLEEILTTTSSTSSTSSTTTSSTTTTATVTITTTTTTISTTTTTATVTTACAPGLTFAVFANRNFSVASQSVINAGTQVNGNLTLTHSGNTFLGTTNVVGTFSDTGGNTFQNLVLNAAPIPFKTFNPTCLMNSANIIINGNVNITSQADAAIFQGNTVWVNGSVTVSGGGITITGGGILATGGISITGGNFTYTSTGCFALYSQTGAININNGPYNIKGLIYTASTTAGDIHLATSQGGSVCGAIIAGQDVIFTGGSAVHSINNTGACSPCILCNDLCPAAALQGTKQIFVKTPCPCGK